MYKTTVR